MENFKLLAFTALLCFQISACTLVIKSKDTVTGIVGKSISLIWEMKNDGRIFGPQIYINTWKNLIIDDTSVITDEGKKLFGKRISRIWKKLSVYYCELTITNLSYSDSLIFQVRVVYEDKNGVHIKQDNTSSINLEVKGGADLCGKQLEDTMDYENEISQTFHLCGNPRPKVSYEINDWETHVVPGTAVDEKTKKYRYVVNITIKPFYCGKTIKYQFTGLKNRTHEVKFIPKRVNVIRYTFNATNCTTVEWEQVNYGTCYPDLKYQLNFVTHEGYTYQQVTNKVNQTAFVDCQDQNILYAYVVRVTAFHQELMGKPSRYFFRPKVKSFTIENKRQSHTIWICVGLGVILVIVIIIHIAVYCLWRRRRKHGSKTSNMPLRKESYLQCSTPFYEEMTAANPTLTTHHGLHVWVDTEDFSATFRKTENVPVTIQNVNGSDKVEYALINETLPTNSKSSKKVQCTQVSDYMELCQHEKGHYQSIIGDNKKRPGAQNYCSSKVEYAPVASCMVIPQQQRPKYQNVQTNVPYDTPHH